MRFCFATVFCFVIGGTSTGTRTQKKCTLTVYRVPGTRYRVRAYRYFNFCTVNFAPDLALVCFNGSLSL